MNANDDEELRTFVASWCHAILTKDVHAATALRSADYHAKMPGGTMLNTGEELEILSGPHLRLETCEPTNLRFKRSGDRATLTYDCAASGENQGVRFEEVAPCIIEARRTAKGWVAVASEVRRRDSAKLPPRSRQSNLRRLRQGLAERIRPRRTTFQEVAYLAYRRGDDYLLPARTEEPQVRPLSIPPEHLWLGYNYPAHGALHVQTMLNICRASGFELEQGCKILDLGCGAGRMIRHLEPFATKANIWGLDISAEHILWCKHNLSPPFNFATITKVPHLPFEDRSFDLIYCGSVFTHIDDLADAWLLELRRVLSPEGRLFVTIHDDHTMALLSGRYRSSPLARLTSHALYREAEKGFSMLTIGRDDASQVFYDRNAFLRMTEPMFKTLSVTEEAYFYQTAVLLGRR